MAFCASCVFGAVSTILHSLSFETLHTITVSLIPQVTIYKNGDHITNYETVTESITEAVHGATTFSNINEITWTVGDVTLTYPTTYVQYLGFEGATLTISNGESCAQTAQASPVILPSSTDPASFIYPSISGGALPTPLLQYLGQLDLVASQFKGAALTGCAPLVPPSISASNVVERRRFEGARKVGDLDRRATLPAFHQANSTIDSILPEITPSSPLSSSQQGSSDGPTSSNVASSSSTHISPNSHPSLTPSFSQSSTPNNGTLRPFGVLTTSTFTTIQTTPTILTSCISANGTANATATSTFHTRTTYRRKSITHTTTYSVSTQIASSPEPPPAYSAPGYTHKTVAGIQFVTALPSTTYIAEEGPKKTKTHEKDDKDGPGGGQTTSRGHNGPPGGGGGGGGQTRVTPQDTQTKQPHDKPNGGDSMVFSFHGSKITEQGGGIVLGSQTVQAGQKITIGEGAAQTTVALQTKAGTTQLVVDGTTYMGQLPAGPTPAPGLPSAIITAGGHTFTIVSSGGSIIMGDGHSSTTVAAGSEATIDGQTVSMPSSGPSVVVNGHTTPLTTPAKATVISAGGHTFTAIDKPGSVVLKDRSSTATIKDGSKTVFEGQTVSIGDHGSVVVVNGWTVPGASASATGVANANGNAAASRRVAWSALYEALGLFYFIVVLIAGF